MFFVWMHPQAHVVTTFQQEYNSSDKWFGEVHEFSRVVKRRMGALQFAEKLAFRIRVSL